MSQELQMTVGLQPSMQMLLPSAGIVHVENTASLNGSGMLVHPTSSAALVELLPAGITSTVCDILSPAILFFSFPLSFSLLLCHFPVFPLLFSNTYVD